MVLGIAALLGWPATGAGLLPTGPGLWSSAPALLLCGVGLISLALGYPLAIPCGLVTVLVSATLLFQYLSGVDLGIGGFLAENLTAWKGFPFERTAPSAVLSFAFIGMALLLMGSRRRRWRPLAAGLLGSVIGAMGLTGLLLGGITALFRGAVITHMPLHNALGFVASGGGILTFAWHDSGPGEEEAGRGSRPWVAVLTGCAFLTATLYLWQVLAGWERTQVSSAIQLAAGRLAGRITAEIESRQGMLVRLARSWEAPERSSSEARELDAKLQISERGGYDSIGWLDSSWRVKWAVPRHRLEAFRKLKAGLEARQPALVGAIALTAGESGVLVSVPVFSGKELDGVVAGLLRSRELIEHSRVHSDTQGFAVSVREGRQEIYRAAPPGDRFEETWSQESKMESSQLGWQVRVWPAAAWLRGQQSALPETVLLAGVLAAATLAWLTGLAQSHRRRAQDAETANQRLGRTVARLQETEAELRKSEERFRTAVESMLPGLGIFAAIRDQSGRVVDFRIDYLNDAACQAIGMSKQESIGKSVRRLIPGHPELALFHQYCQVAETGDPLATELVSYGSLSHPQIISKALDVRVAKLGDGVVAAWVDITEHKRVEEERRQSKERYHAFFEGVPVGLYRTSPSGEILEANPAVVRLLRCPDLDTLRAFNTNAFYIDPVERERQQHLLDSTGVVRGFETRVMCFDGSVIWMRDTSRAVRDEQGNLLYYEGMIEDITEKKLADEQIRKSLAEKELLLKEIHHRVKNNLQVICSLLSLQSGYITDRKALAMFNESQDRVRSMALVHERLYQSQDLARIDFAEYVRSLVPQLVHAYGSSSGPVAIKVNVKDVLFGIDEAVSCGLIINELVSNSLKHAFPQRRGGEIGVTVDIRNEEYVLTISDNGVGLPADLHSRKAEGLGLQLVSTLTEQLGGSIEVTSGQGTQYRISFPERGH